HRGWIDELSDTQNNWAGILAWYTIIHLGPEELPKALVALRAGLVDDGSLLMSFFSGPYAEAFEQPVTTAHRWPLAARTQAVAYADDFEHPVAAACRWLMSVMAPALEHAGFEVRHRYGGYHSPHAYIIARAVPKQT